jgi:hypothetical protein
MIALGQPVQQAATWSPEEEQELVRRIDKRLMPLLVITYGLQYYDKVMLSQAACVVRAQARYTTNHTNYVERRAEKKSRLRQNVFPRPFGPHTCDGAALSCAFQPCVS